MMIFDRDEVFLANGEFIAERALANLLFQDLLAISQPKEHLGIFILAIDCDQLFEAGVVDRQLFSLEQLKDITEDFFRHGHWSVVRWTCKKRNRKPRKMIVHAMKRESAWDETMEKLKENNNE